MLHLDQPIATWAPQPFSRMHLVMGSILEDAAFREVVINGFDPVNEDAFDGDLAGYLDRVAIDVRSPAEVIQQAVADIYDEPAEVDPIEAARRELAEDQRPLLHLVR